MSSSIIDSGLQQINVALKNSASETPGTTLKGIREAHRNISQAEDHNSRAFSPNNRYTEEKKVTHLTARLVFDINTKRSKLVENYHCSPHQNKLLLAKDVNDLAGVLSNIDPLRFGLLRCESVAIDGPTDDPNGFKLIFEIPEELGAPRSLRSLLIASSKMHGLQERLQLARALARSVIYMHSAKFVHKNIRPETVVMFRNENSSLGIPFLVGFEHFRPKPGVSERGGDELWERNIYRHPRRQGKRPEEDYRMQHDIYSLGVCLLEIGLWTSFVHYEFADMEMSETIAMPGPDIQQFKETDTPAYANLLKGHFITMSTDRLAASMGQKYASVTLTCLTCLDANNKDFPVEDNARDKDQISVGVDYIEKVLTEIESINL